MKSKGQCMTWITNMYPNVVCLTEHPKIEFTFVSDIHNHKTLTVRTERLLSYDVLAVLFR